MANLGRFPSKRRGRVGHHVYWPCRGRPRKCRAQVDTQPHPSEPAWIETLFSTPHPLFTCTLEDVQARVRCHSPTKAEGDPFAAAFTAFVHDSPRTTHADKRRLFVLAATDKLHCQRQGFCCTFSRLLKGSTVFHTVSQCGIGASRHAHSDHGFTQIALDRGSGGACCGRWK